MNNKRAQITRLASGLLALALVLTFIPLTGEPTVAASGTPVFINEVHYDNTGADVGEAVEVAGTAGTDLSGWSLVLYNGKGGAPYNTVALSGVIQDQQDGFGTLFVSLPANGLQNGSPDGIALVNASSTVVQFLSYEGSFNAVGGPADGMTSTDIGVDEPYNTPVGNSLQLAGTGSVYEDFVWDSPAPNTFGAVNTGQTFVPSGGGPADPVINEFVFNHDGTDTNEFVEVFGDPNTDYSAFTVLEIEGDSTGAGVIDGAFPVGTANAGGFWTTGFLNNQIENGTVTLLLVEDFTGSVGDDLDTSNNGSLDTTPWARIVDDVAVNDGGSSDRTYASVVLTRGFDGISFTVGGASRIPNGTDTDAVADWTRNDFDGEGLPGFTGSPDPGEALNTPGTVNEIVSAGPEITPIYDIQHTTDPGGASPYAGQTVTTQGLVTAVFGGRVFIQDGSGPWSGLLLYNPNGTMNVGDLVEVMGEVSEHYGLTELTSGEVTVLNSGNPLPEPEKLSSGDVSQEQWESVLVRVENATVTNENLGHGEWLMDDGSDPVRVDDMGSYSYTPKNNDLMDFVQGPLYYSYGNFKIEPRDDNDLSRAEMCGDPFTPVYEIQGSGPASPLDGSKVSVEGIVTGDFQGNDELKGFFIQDPGGDDDSTTSDGIFVYSSTDVSVGDAVRVAGEVDEHYGLTEITYVETVLVCETGSVAPTVINLPVADTGDWEQYEGMLVTFPEPLSATDAYNVHRYGEVIVSSEGRLEIPTNSVYPGDDANAVQELNDRRRLLVDDGSTRQFPATVPYLAADNTLRLGDTLTDLTGVLSYSYDEYRLHPTEWVEFTRANPRTTAPDDVGGVVKIATFNLLNYWTTIDDGNNDARGADSLAEFERQKAKTMAAILAMDADVVGLQELENNGDVATGDLVAALNDATAPDTWAAVPDPDYPGGLESTNAIKVGIIYRADRVTPVGDPVADDDEAFATDRPPIAQTFDAYGELFTVVVNHFKSKGCYDLTGPDDPNQDQGDGQSCYNYRRTRQAEALLDFVTYLRELSGDDDVLVIGDLNSYAQEDPIVTLESGLVNQADAFVAPEDRYSYIYFGQAGLLDHVFTTDGLAGRVTGVDAWHINSDEPRVLDYNDEVIDPAESYRDFSHDYLYNPDPFRSSDHDPLIVGFCDAVPPEVVVSVTPDTLWPPNHKYVIVNAIVNVSDNIDPNPMLTLVSVTSNEPDDGLGDGDMPDDIVIVDDFMFKLRAERSGNGSGRVYTITYQATDACGNSTVATATVTVPHDQGSGGN